MSCARGCCATTAEHYRSIRVASPDRHAMTRTTTDDHGTHTVDVTQHWHDQQDVTVKPPTLHVSREQL